MVYKGLPHKFSLFLVPACRFEEGGCSASPWLWKRGKRFRAWQGVSCSPWVIPAAVQGLCCVSALVLCCRMWDSFLRRMMGWMGSSMVTAVFKSEVWAGLELLRGACRCPGSVQSGMAGGCKHILYAECHWVRISCFTAPWAIWGCASAADCWELGLCLENVFQFLNMLVCWSLVLILG